MTKQTVHIIGAGISGLRCAEILCENDIDVHLIEQTDSIGGRMKTTEKSGFLLDHGFHVMQTGYRYSRNAIDFDSLGSRSFSPGATIVTSVNGIVKFTTLSDPLRKPLASLSALKSQKWSDLAKIAKLQFSLKYLPTEKLLSGGDNTTEYFLDRIGFSESFKNEFIRPLFSGIFLESGLQTSERMFKFVFASMARGKMVLPREGIQAYPNLLANKIGRQRITLSTTAEAINSKTVKIDDSLMSTDQVVVAHAPKEEMKTMRKVWTVYYCAPRSPIKGNYLIVNGDYEIGKNVVAHLAVPSDVQPSYSPPDQALVAVTVVGDAADALGLKSKESVKEQVGKEVKNWFPESRKWDVLDVIETRYALPARGERSGISNMPKIKENTIISCGDHMTHGSMEGAIMSADHAASEVMRRLTLDK
tara:strand:- start:880 stop:2133 length:1254 start_codon:yes stop_codon:yes gene_type:complete